jgi:hypothetical protein
VIIRTLKTNKFTDKDINKIYDEIKSYEEPATGIRITLYELRGEYVEAFKLHLSTPDLKKNIFRWIDQSLTYLAEQGDDTDSFMKNLTQQNEKKLQEGGDLATPTSFNKETLAAVKTPAGILKVGICQRMKDLATISVDDTLMLVEKWFSHEYQLNLIMHDLDSVPQI